MANVFSDPNFFFGSFLAAASLSAAVVLFAFSLSSSDFKRRRYITPVALFLIPYTSFLCLLYLRPFISVEYVPSANSSEYYGWTPSLATVGIYLLGGLAFFAGFIAFPATSERYGRFWNRMIRPIIRSVFDPLRHQKLAYFFLAVLLMWGIGLVANLLIFLQVRGIPLFRIELRGSMDPKLTFLSEMQPLLILIAPYVSPLRTAAPPKLRWVVTPPVYGLLVGISLVALAFEGARNIPAKLILSLVLFWMISIARQPGEFTRRLKVLVPLGIGLFVIVGIAGALTKIEIYGLDPGRLPGTVFGSFISDSLGNIYSFESLVNYSGLYGHFRGDLLWTTILSYVPGRDELYANYIVGQVLGYRPDQLRSIASTFNGPAFLDFGVLGVLVNSFVTAFILGYGWKAAKATVRNLGALSLFLATLVLGIHLGTYNIWMFFTGAVLVLVVEFNRAV